MKQKKREDRRTTVIDKQQSAMDPFTSSQLEGAKGTPAKPEAKTQINL